MKIYNKIVLDENNKIILEDSFEYNGPISKCGIHYDYKSTRGAKAMEKKRIREEKLRLKREKKQAKSGYKKKDEDKTIPVDELITLEHLTRNNSDKK